MEHDRTQLVIAILLAVAALLTAYATWMNQLHASNQAANYAYSSRLNAEATAYSATKAIEYSNDMAFWYELSSLSSQRAYYVQLGDSLTADAYSAQIEKLLNAYDEEFAAACRRALETGGEASPFDEYPLEAYFQEFNELSNKAAEARSNGDWDNLKADSFGLAQVLYSVVLFLLGLAGAWKDRRSKRVIIAASVAMLVLAFLYMVTLPLPTDFNFLQYLSQISG